MNNFSIIIPVYNESKNIDLLVKEIYENLTEYKNFELIIINDSSTDNTEDILNEMKKNRSIKIINNDKNLGQSFSIKKGIENSLNNTVVTIDGDGQNNPLDIPKLLKLYFSNKKISLVAGIRKKRKDNYVKIFSSRLANNFRAFILKDNCKDTGCSLKVFDKEIFLSFPFFDGIHRFLPALFNGFDKKVFFVDVDHRNRVYGSSKYGTLKRMVNGIIDIVRVIKIIKDYKKSNA
jgi:dolichol-phosphate mannosyltransferase